MTVKYSEKHEFISNFKDNVLISKKVESKVENRQKTNAFKYCKRCDKSYKLNDINFYYWGKEHRCKICEKTRNQKRIEKIKSNRRDLNILEGRNINYRSHFLKDEKRRCCKCNIIYPLTSVFFHIRNLNLKNKSKRFHSKCKNCRIPLKKSIANKIKNDSIFCAYCGIKFIDNIKKTIDHVIPTSKNGKDNIENLNVCCKNCNSRKSDIDLKNFLNKNINNSLQI